MYNQYRSLQQTLEDTDKIGTPAMPSTMPQNALDPNSEENQNAANRPAPPKQLTAMSPDAQALPKGYDAAAVQQQQPEDPSARAEYESLISGQSEPDDHETQQMRADAALDAIDTAGRKADYRTQQAINKAEKGRNTTAGRMRQAGDVLEWQARHQSNLANEEYNRVDAQYQQAKVATDEYRAKMQGAINDMDGMSKRIAAEQPHDIWADSSTGVKVAAIALTSLGAAFQSYYGDKTNPVTDQINAVINRDLTMQRMRLEKNKDDYAMQSSLVGRMAQYTNDLQQAQDMAYSVAINGVKGRLEGLKPLFQSQEHQQAIERQIGDLENRGADTAMRIQQMMGGGAVQRAEAKAQLEVQREKALAGAEKPMTDYQRSKEERLNQAEQRKQNELEVPGYHLIDAAKGVTAMPKEVAEFRNKNAEASNAIRSLDHVIDRLRHSSPVSWTDWKELKSAMGRANLKLKGKDLFNGGAAFSLMEKQLQMTSYLGGSGETMIRMDPTSWKRIATARNDLLRDVHTAGGMLNLAPDEE